MPRIRRPKTGPPMNVMSPRQLPRYSAHCICGATNAIRTWSGGNKVLGTCRNCKRFTQMLLEKK